MFNIIYGKYDSYQQAGNQGTFHKFTFCLLVLIIIELLEVFFYLNLMASIAIA